VIYMRQIMRAVVTGGTGTRARIEGVPTVGKTGTTSDYRDAWFCGFSGNYVTTVWFGNDNYEKTNRLTGGLLPAMAWQKYMAFAHTNIEVKPIEGVDFEPAPFVIAKAEPAAPEAVQPERPPGLKPEAAQKLLEVADRLKQALGAQPAEPGSKAAELAPPPVALKSM
jgi:penicillin-binding protein 1A